MRKRGQVWIETVLYTLIGLALIGITLAVITPKINESQDRIVVEQSIASLNVFESTIKELLSVPEGNRREIPEFAIRRGDLFIDAGSDKIYFMIDDLKNPYSEPGVVISAGNVDILSEEGQKLSSVTLTLDYEGRANLKFAGTDSLKKFNPASVPYRFYLENKRDGTNEIIIDIVEA
jgi:type II secretory pathway pseudopilin PulG